MEMLESLVGEMPAVGAILIMVYFFLKHIRGNSDSFETTLKSLNDARTDRDKLFAETLRDINETNRSSAKQREERLITHQKNMNQKYAGNIERMVDELKTVQERSDTLTRAVLDKLGD